MADEEPADDAAARVQRHDDFGAEGVERATHQGAVRLIGLREAAARDEVRMQFEPAHERIAFRVFDFVCLRQAAQARAQAVAIALPDTRENADPRDAGGVCHAFDDAGEQRLDVVEAPEDARKAEERRGRGVAFRHRLAAARRFGVGEERRLVAQFPVLLHHAQMIKRTRNQRLKTAAIKLQIFRRVDAGLLGLAQRLGTRSAERDDQHFGPVGLNLPEQIARIFAAQIHQQHGGIRLLEHCVETVCFRYVTHLREHAQERLHAPREIGVLRVEDADGRASSCRHHVCVAEPHERQRDEEGRPSRELARHFDLPAVFLDDAVHNGEAEAGAVILRGEKRIKDVRPRAPR